MRSLVILFVVATATSLGAGQTARPSPGRTLTFAERVAYQYEIEEVYWRHRIWPKENPGSKPLLDQVMSRADIERKVEDYLRNSQRLANQWQRRITPSDLQAEMDRMASHTKQPDVLRELFAALNNDPFIIAECLARPILAERFVSMRNDVEAFLSNALALAAASAPTAKYTLPEISPLDCSNDMWNPTSTIGAPDARSSHTTVWTGTEMIVWGGVTDIGYSVTGGKYNPSTDVWTSTTTINAPAGRYGQTAVWSGTQMIVWGGYHSAFLNTGGRYNPSADTWSSISVSNSPVGRAYHTAVWTGTEMIVSAGATSFTTYTNTGGRYNPSADTWTVISTTNVPSARYRHTAVWTGSKMIIWGGFNNGHLNSGGRYDPDTDTWIATSTAGAPDGRDDHTAVWTGSQMIVWGGLGNNSPPGLNTGGRYNPVMDSWTSTTTTSAPTGRYGHSAVWAASKMIVWGGTPDGSNYLNTGESYDPSSDNWTAISIVGAPDARDNHTAVWTGSEMLVWGGGNDVDVFNTGGRYCAQASAPTVQSAVSRKIHGGNPFDITLPGIECRTTGGTNDYTLVVTFSGNVTVTGNPQAQLIAGTGCVGSAGVCTGNVSVSGAVVTVPLTNIINDQNIIVRINGVNGVAETPATDFDFHMGILIGDTNGNGTVNAADVAQTKGRLGQAVNGTNFRSDVNANGSINAADTAIVKQNSGTSLPP